MPDLDSLENLETNGEGLSSSDPASNSSSDDVETNGGRLLSSDSESSIGKSCTDATFSFCTLCSLFGERDSSLPLSVSETEE